MAAMVVCVAVSVTPLAIAVVFLVQLVTVMSVVRVSSMLVLASAHFHISKLVTVSERVSCILGVLHPLVGLRGNA